MGAGIASVTLSDALHGLAWACGSSVEV